MTLKSIFKERPSPFWELGYATIHELETEQGILASGSEEIFGCVFGRDSLITSLQLLSTYERTPDPYFLTLVKKILVNLLALQGTAVNIESGEEPGKCIHEFRPTRHEHLTKRSENPWYVYPDNVMRNYDTVDATPLLLIALHEYYRVSGDEEFFREALPQAYAAIRWIMEYGDTDGDGFIDYHFDPDRTHGGLRAQSWMDSTESLFHEDGSPVVYPIAPVEVQAYSYAALRMWSDFFAKIDPAVSTDLDARTKALKKSFNEKFVYQDDRGRFGLAFGVDGAGKPLTASRSSMGHCLWASWKSGGMRDTILDQKLVSSLVARLTAPDLFESAAGIRTLSTESSHFDPQSYHNGSIWPHDTAIIAEGLERFGYRREAMKIHKALMSAYAHFKTPIELFAFSNGSYHEYLSLGGQGACRKQAWSAASLLAESAAARESRSLPKTIFTRTVSFAYNLKSIFQH